MLSLGHDDREDPYPAEKLVRVEGVYADGSPLPAVAAGGSGPPFWSIDPPPGLAMLAVTYRGGMSGQRPDGQWVEGPRGTDPAVLRVGRYDKYLLAILDPGADTGRAPATRLQLIPDRNPLRLQRGDQLTVELRLDGRPLAGVAIMADYSGNADVVHATTDANGRAVVRVQNQGLNVLAAVWIEPVAGDPSVDFVEHLATLSFALRPASHRPGYLHPAMRPPARPGQAERSDTRLSQ